MRNDVRALIHLAATWRMLALLFERPKPGWLEEVRSLEAELPNDPELAAAVREAASVDEGAYLAALGPGGAVSPREVAYRPMGDPGRILAEVSSHYEAFAFRPASEDPHDHVAVEAGFVGYLALKEAFARSRGEPEGAEASKRTRESFLRDHLAAFAGELAGRLEHAPLRHLALAASALASRCPVDGSVERAAEFAAAAPCSVDGDALDCGGCPKG